ncbi:hypothetical protein WJX81_000178 [Elliptochloris bilobata]|uniref:Uncharacterized protein n=1 Tax=Elliptochloris bilobata TaxID=381761 RepID=A0AAW1QZ29_9CHLO
MEEPEVTADALGVEDFDKKRDSLREKYGARKNAFSGVGEAAAAYFAAGLAWDVFCCVAAGSAKGRTIADIAKQLKVDKAEVTKVLEREADFSGVFQPSGKLWHLATGAGLPGHGAQEIWLSLQECLRGSPGLTIKELVRKADSTAGDCLMWRQQGQSAGQEGQCRGR